jgi:anaerobic magnesium-protoporphyrin IX monomethyl ester cyclase
MKVPDVLLINPPYEARVAGGRIQPMGLAYVAASLNAAGARVEILDLANALHGYVIGDERAAVTALESWMSGRATPAIVGIGPLTTASIRSAGALANACRGLGVNLVIGGGPLCSAPRMAEAADYLGLDAFVAGDGESPSVGIWASRAGRDVSAIPGVGTPRSAPPEPHREWDLDSLPLPARHLLPIESTPSARRSLAAGRVTPAFLSRGCPYSCSFCAAPLASGRRVRRFSSARVTLELNQCASHAYDEIIFYDDCLFVRSPKLDQRISEFTGAMARSMWRGKYQLELRCDAIEKMADSSLASLAASGCRQVNMGIEKGHSAGLDALRKRLTPEVASFACSRLREFGIRSVGTFIIGGPGERTHADLRTTIEFACSLDLDFAHFNPMAVYPGTALFEQLYPTHPAWLELCLSPDLAPFGDLLWQTEEIKLSDVLAVVDAGYREFYTDQRLNRATRTANAAERAGIRAAYEQLRTERSSSWRRAASPEEVPAVA